ncbi:hypothetical protein [Melghirimyces algeriensis]|uniref:Uncharacterized protein n=1 Tax=Melghirimyces algeriensis TaxID=910412 RepID=A0A521EA97_9BACL|nr:hypothetical protein [Melghirimyces algeriensis]SMO80371.1 hypothetical protein SAMN06264849_108105 [Melghirimyces algeriensis]
MLVKIMQGTGLGLVSSIILGILFGVTGMGMTWFTIAVMGLVVYFVTGYVAGRQTDHPYTGKICFSLSMIMPSF